MVAGHSLETMTIRVSDDAMKSWCNCGWSSEWCGTSTRAIAQWHDHADDMEPPVSLQEAKQ